MIMVFHFLNTNLLKYRLPVYRRVVLTWGALVCILKQVVINIKHEVSFELREHSQRTFKKLPDRIKEIANINNDVFLITCDSPILSLELQSKYFFY